MGLLKNDDRRLAQKAPKKPKNPLRDPVRATAAGPVKAAETTVLDGLSAEAVAAALYGVRAELDAGRGQLPPPLSPSG